MPGVSPIVDGSDAALLRATPLSIVAMRIIAGEFRSRVLRAPNGMATRPTTDRLRETLFNVLQPRLQGARFLDLYAGSGANGLEALSRGAREAVLVERAAPALAAIRANVAALGLEKRARVEGMAVGRWLDSAAAEAPFDLVFLDPPYDEVGEYDRVLLALGGKQEARLADGGVVVAEERRVRQSGAARTIPAGRQYGSLREYRLLEQGDAALRFFRRE